MSVEEEGRSISRVYADANESFGRQWWDYGKQITQALGHTLDSSSCCGGLDTLVVSWGSQEGYEVVKKVGRGKYSEVSNTQIPALVLPN